jgi:hypothetical protein
LLILMWLGASFFSSVLIAVGLSVAFFLYETLRLQPSRHKEAAAKWHPDFPRLFRFGMRTVMPRGDQRILDNWPQHGGLHGIALHLSRRRAVSRTWPVCGNWEPVDKDGSNAYRNYQLVKVQMSGAAIEAGLHRLAESLSNEVVDYDKHSDGPVMNKANCQVVLVRAALAFFETREAIFVLRTIFPCDKASVPNMPWMVFTYQLVLQLPKPLGPAMAKLIGMFFKLWRNPGDMQAMRDGLAALFFLISVGMIWVAGPILVKQFLSALFSGLVAIVAPGFGA